MADYIVTTQYWGSSYWGGLYWGLLIPVDIQYTEVMAFTVKAYTTADFDVVLPNDTSGDVDVLGEVVSGAGSTAVNGGYTLIGASQWKKTDAEIYIVKVFEYWWILDSGGGDYYTAESGALTPDLVTNWTVRTDGALPLPTIVVGTIGTIPTLGALVSLTLESPQLVSLTLYKELSQ